MPKQRLKIGKYDAICSLMARERDGKCQAPGCNKTQFLNAHHIFPRGRKSTRFDLKNLISLCATHHTFSSEWSAHKTNETFKIWLKQRIGEDFYYDLERKSLRYMSEKKAIEEFKPIADAWKSTHDTV